MKCTTLSAIVFFVASVASAKEDVNKKLNDEPSGNAYMRRAEDKRLLQTSCQCGGGLDYGCDQRTCGPDATCDAGHCIQDNLVRPSCGGGDCSQANATEPRCQPHNNCCPPKEKCDVVGTNEECIGEDMRVFSCTHNKFVALKDVRIGESIRSTTFAGEPTCSDIYYVFKHENSAASAYAIEVDGQPDKIIVSANHLVYVGNDYSGRRNVLAKDVAVGDMLVSSSSSSSSAHGISTTTRKVLSIETTRSKLVNVLTYEPSIELEQGIIISAHSFHETLYSYVFWPFALAHKYLGLSIGENTESFLRNDIVRKTVLAVSSHSITMGASCLSPSYWFQPLSSK